MKLYDYYRSSASYRVRIALNCKHLSYESIPVHLVNHGGEQHHEEYMQLNPQELVPTLVKDGDVITQSLAIIEYLEETSPHPSLLPKTPFERAEVRSLALMVACDMHPLNNLRVLKQLKEQFGADEGQVQAWYHLWLHKGFKAFETKLQSLPREKSVCYGQSISMADVCLIPQVYNAKRFKLLMDEYPLINAINDYCLTLPAFINASPVEP